MVLDGEGTFVAANSAFCELVQRPRDALLQLRFSDLLPKAEAALFDRFLERFRASDEWPVLRGEGLSLLPAEEGEPTMIALRTHDAAMVALEVEFHRRGGQLEGFALPRPGPFRRAS